MSKILFYNPSAVVANQAVNLLRSAHTPDYYNVPNIVINPDLSSVNGVPMNYWVVPDGTNVSEMNSSQKNAVDASLLPGIKAAKKIALDNELESFMTGRGYDLETRSNLQAMYSDGIRGKPKKGKYIQPMINWLHSVDTELSTKLALVDVQTTAAGVNAVTLDLATLTATDPLVTITGAVTTTDSTTLDSFMDANAEVTDLSTGVVGPYYLMEILNHRRDLYNDSTNPVYIPGRPSILGSNGILQDHANRVLNLEDIHQKQGWHEQQVFKSLYQGPQNLLIYYGYPNSFNSATNQWNNEKVAQDMAKYTLIVLGDGVENPAHPDYSNTQIIIPRIKALNSSCQIFGYAAVAQTYSAFVTKADQWNTLQIHGIFMDEAGYDYGKTRSEFNALVDYVHGLTYANICFANAWNPNHIDGIVEDPSFPNSTYNTGSEASHLNENDWILLESFPVNTTAYAGGIESATDWNVRGQEVINLRTGISSSASYGVNFCACGVINNDNTNGSSLFDFGYVSSLLYSLDGYGTSDSNYAASSAAVTFWPRPNTSGMNNVWSLDPTVTVGTDNTNVYHRYTDNAHVTLDFSSHMSGIEIYQEATGTGSGSTGLQGATGLSGTGVTGLQGSTGLFGLQGVTGLSGTGVTGLQGLTGLAGSTPYTIVYKASDETRTSTTSLTADSDLIFGVSSNSKYLFESKIFYATGATPDFKYDLNLLNGTLGSCIYSGFHNPHGGTTSAQSGVRKYLNVSTAITTTTVGYGYVYLDGSIEIGANAGTLQFRWAQNTSDATNTVVLRGSYMRYKSI